MDHKSYIQFIIVMLMRFNLIFGLFRFIFGSFPVLISWIKLRKVLYIYIEEHLCLIPSILGTSGALEWMLIGSKVGILNFSGTLGGHFQYPSSSSHVGYRFRPPWTDLSKKSAAINSDVINTEYTIESLEYVSIPIFNKVLNQHSIMNILILNSP